MLTTYSSSFPSACLVAALVASSALRAGGEGAGRERRRQRSAAPREPLSHAGPGHASARPTARDVTVTGPTPFGALERASRRGEFYYPGAEHLVRALRRPDRPARRPAARRGWVYKVNHVSPPVGADAYRLEGRATRCSGTAPGSAPQGGPKTLDLGSDGDGCFRAFAYDDNGDRSRARDVVFVRDAAGASARTGAATARAASGTAFGRPRRARSARIGSRGRA